MLIIDASSLSFFRFQPVVREQHIDLVLDFDDKLFKGHKYDEIF